MAPILYKADASPPARTVLIVLDLLGVEDIEIQDLNPVLREQDTPELRKKNPMRTVPMLDEGDFSLADSHAIILYLLEKYARPEHSYLYPADKRARATINQRLFFDCGVLFTILLDIMGPIYIGKITELTNPMKSNIDEAYDILEIYLEDGPYMAGDNMTIADISILTTISTLNGLHPIDKQRCPRLKQWINKMDEKEVCKRINAPGSELHVFGIKALMENAKYLQQSKI